MTLVVFNNNYDNYKEVELKMKNSDFETTSGYIENYQWESKSCGKNGASTCIEEQFQIGDIKFHFTNSDISYHGYKASKKPFLNENMFVKISYYKKYYSSKYYKNDYEAIVLKIESINQFDTSTSTSTSN